MFPLTTAVLLALGADTPESELQAVLSAAKAAPRERNIQQGEYQTSIPGILLWAETYRSGFAITLQVSISEGVYLECKEFEGAFMLEAWGRSCWGPPSMYATRWDAPDNGVNLRGQATPWSAAAKSTLLSCAAELATMVTGMALSRHAGQKEARMVGRVGVVLLCYLGLTPAEIPQALQAYLPAATAPA